MSLIGLDWVQLAVPDLGKASVVLENTLGLMADNGRAQLGWGTTNRVVEFPTSYLELMAVTSTAEGSHRPAKHRIVHIIEQGGGWSLFGLRVDDVAHTWTRLSAAGLRRTPPEANSSEYADGTVRRWMVGGHGEEHASGQPSFCEYVDSPYRYDEPGSSSPSGPLRIRDIMRADVAVHDLAPMTADLSKLLEGAPQPGYDHGLTAHTAMWTLPDRRRIRLLAPADDSSPIEHHLSTRREGLYGVAFSVADANAAGIYLTTRGIKTSPTGHGDEILISTESTLGARMTLQTSS